MMHLLIRDESGDDEGEHEPQVVNSTDQGPLPRLTAQVELKIDVIMFQGQLVLYGVAIVAK